MRMVLIIAAVIAVLLGVFGGVILLNLSSQSPKALLDRLARGKGDRNQLIMRLNVVRGDVVTPMIQALQDTSAPAAFRADVLELLFKRNFRSAEDRIERALLAAAKDADPLVRQTAVYGLAVYGNDRLQVGMIDCVDDPDAKVRRQAYMIFGRPVWHQMDPEEGVWKLLSPDQRTRLVDVCLARARSEETPEMRVMARAIVGREVEIRGYKAKQALQASELTKAEELLRGALALDSGNQQAQIRLVRFLLKTGDKDKALALARKYGALLAIPRLSQAPKIDGDPSEEVWAEAFKAEEFWNDSRWVSQRAAGKSKFYIGHRDGKIYIAGFGYDKELDKLVRKHTVRDTDVWRDDCFELLFDPGSTEKDVYQFVINPVGTKARAM